MDFLSPRLSIHLVLFSSSRQRKMSVCMIYWRKNWSKDLIQIYVKYHALQYTLEVTVQSPLLKITIISSLCTFHNFSSLVIQVLASKCLFLIHIQVIIWSLGPEKENCVGLTWISHRLRIKCWSMFSLCTRLFNLYPDGPWSIYGFEHPNL